MTGAQMGSAVSLSSDGNQLLSTARDQTRDYQGYGKGCF